MDYENVNASNFWHDVGLVTQVGLRRLGKPTRSKLERALTKPTPKRWYTLAHG